MERRTTEAVPPEAKFVLGIDLGTTSVKIALYNAQTNRIFHSASCETHAKIAGGGAPDQPGQGAAAEQVTNKILDACEMCLNQADVGLLSKVQRIGIAGQMHGCVCWYNGGGRHSHHLSGRME